MSINKRDTLIKVLKDIINSDSGYRPTPDDNKWKSVNDREYKIIKSSTNYKITDKLLQLMDKYYKIYKYLKLKDHLIEKYNDNVAILYIIENGKTSEKYVGYTTLPMFTFIKLNIHNYNNNEDSVFDNFDNTNSSDSLTNYTFEIIEYILYRDRKDIIERKIDHKKLFTSDTHNYNRDVDKDETVVGGLLKEEVNKDTVDKIYEKRMPLYYDLVKQQSNQFKPFIGYIYKVFNVRNNKVFIIGYHRELTKNDLLDMVDRSTKIAQDISKYGRRNFDYELVETYHAQTLFDFLFRVDYYKVKLDTINNGYNDSYNIEESNLLFGNSLLTRKRDQFVRNMFLRLQKYLFEKNLRDTTNYDNFYGIVYEVLHRKSKMRYIGYAHNSKLKHVILDMYDKALLGNVKQNKLLKALSEEYYDAFNFTVKKIKYLDDTKIDLHEEAEKLITKFDTVDNGYNIKSRSNNIVFGKTKEKKAKTSKPFWL